MVDSAFMNPVKTEQRIWIRLTPDRCVRSRVWLWEGKGREGKGKGKLEKRREGKGREGKGREGKGREGKGRAPDSSGRDTVDFCSTAVRPVWEP